MENKGIPEKLKHIIAEGTADGIGIAVSLHIQQNRIKIRPTSKSRRPIDDIILLLMADYEKVKISYPFGDNSIKAKIDGVCSEYLLAFEMLFYGDEPESVRFANTRKLVRTVVAGEVLELLEPIKAEFAEVMERVRQEGLGDGPLPEFGPNQ